MRVLRTIREVRDWRSAVRGSVGLVPTMGALHAGHRSLLERARKDCDVVASTIFVNPTQFAPGEDLDRYPRTWDRDLETMDGLVDAVFAPAVDELYQRRRRAEDEDEGFSSSDFSSSGFFSVTPPATFARLPEAAARPGHFSGVATVCAKLFHIVTPTAAYFGQKDALQCVALRRLVADLNFDLDIRVCPTARDHDGLALSSRNAYLDERARRAAPVVFRSLRAARDLWKSGGGGAVTNPAVALGRDALVGVIREVLASEPLVDAVEYISVADYDTMVELSEAVPPYDPHRTSPAAILSVAVRLAGVRLIDNLPLLF
mmetsp:Transcript_1842/g.6211  ORF Transcript_1842/g.6211 Transcript_1842/m.6211 type:complete len:317 (+) Transcript_1842:48-998(+)